MSEKDVLLAARATLREAICEACYTTTPADRERIIDAFLAHPSELVGVLLAATKPCETCERNGVKACNNTVPVVSRDVLLGLLGCSCVIETSWDCPLHGGASEEEK